MNFLYSLKHKLAKVLAGYIEGRAKLFFERKPELWREITEYRSKSNSTGAQYSDFEVLYKWVRKHKPKEVLECGTGLTTMIMAFALKENEKDSGIVGRITSMEEYENYYTDAVNLMPKDLNKYVDIRLSPVVEECYQFVKGVRYTDVPDRDYELVFIDGPSFHTNPKMTDKYAFEMDYLWLLKDSQRKIPAIIDTRTAACFIYNLFLNNKFKFDRLRRIGVIYPASKDDIRTVNAIVHNAISRGDFKRTSLIDTLSGEYFR
ncbi:MAG TPA: hypothetical protein VEA59_00670 [Patescibacteria group bacterium]|nr:hypothetical protein [Patescibacteria group bacterium]